MNKINAEGIAKHLLIGIVLITVMALPAAASVLDIEVTEYLNVEDTFNGTLSQGQPTGSGVINITNTLTSTALYDISLNFTKGTTTQWETSSPGVTLDTSNADYVIVNINSLNFTDDMKTITYQCDNTRPLAFEESYGSDKLLVNDSTTVSLTLSNTIDSAITNIELIKTAANIDNDADPDFVFSDATATVETPSISASGHMITWNGFDLPIGTTATLDFTATENDAGFHTNSESQSAVEYYMGNATVEFTINDGTSANSGVTVAEEPTAITSNFSISLDKNQLDQAEGGDGGGDDWGFTPSVSNTDSEGIEFSISAVNVYVTGTTDLNETAAFATTTYTDVSLASGETWTASEEWKVLNFTDPVPVGWIDVDLSVNFSEDLPEEQLVESYTTSYGNYMLIEKIYIINGYLVEARKTISKNNTEEDLYDISLWVHNKGSLATPPHVVVYDIVPENFTMEYNDTPYTGSTPIITPFQGTAYWWDVGSLAADGNVDDQTYVNYTVSGTGIYSMSDLFILGIDPAYSLNLPSTPVLTTGSKVAATTGMQSIMSVLMLVSLLVGVVGMRRNRKD